MYCPKCGSQNCQEEGYVFYEKGDFDGNHYSEEGYAREYSCLNCEESFFLKD